MNRLSSQHWKVVAIVALSALAVGLLAVYLLTPHVKRVDYVEGRPLLGQAGERFVDSQVGLRFDPPSDWAMQGRSSDPPGRHRKERMLVKYKRLITGTPGAWLRVSVADVAEKDTPEALASQQKSPDANWKRAGDVEGGLSIAGKSAARVTFAGPFDPDGKGHRDFVCEIMAIKAGDKVFYFTGTFPAGDKVAQQSIRTAVNSVAID